MLAERGERPAPRRDRTTIEAAVVALLVTIVYLLLRPDPLRSLGTMYDDVVYLSLGKAISAGHGYRSDHLVGAPVHEKFPPGLPALYALFWLLGGTLERTVRLAVFASTAAVGGAAGLVWYYSRRALGNGRVTSAVLAVQPLVLLASVRYFSGAASEPWFVLCWAAALVLAWRVTSVAPGSRGGSAIGLGLVLAAATFIRTQAVVLIPAILVALLLGRAGARNVLRTLVAAGLPLVLWRLWHAQMVARGPVASQPDQIAYSEWIPHNSVEAFTTFSKSVLTVNGVGYTQMAAVIVAGWYSPKAQVIIAIVAVLMMIGIVRALRPRPELWTTLGANGVVILLWPFIQDRFLIAVMPFVGLAAAYGLEWLFARRVIAARRAVRGAVLAGMVGASLYLGQELGRAVARGAQTAGAGSEAVVFSRTFQQRSRDVTDWVRANTRPTDRIMAELGGGIYLRTGRQTVVAMPEEPFTGPTVLRPRGRYMAERILADSVTHIIAWSNTARSMAKHVDALNKECPGSVEPLPPFLPDTSRLITHYYRVHRDERCLRDFLARHPRSTTLWKPEIRLRS